MAVTTSRASAGLTTDGVTYTTASFTPAVGDLLVGWFGVTGSTSTDWTVTDTQSGTWTKIGRTVKAASADILEFWVRNTLITSASAMTCTYSHASGTATGGIWAVNSVSGMTLTGANAVRGGQFAVQDNQTSTTPSLVLPASALTTNPTLVGFYVTNTVNTTTFSGWTLLASVNYSTPSTQLRNFSRDSGFTATTATGNASVGVTYSGAIVELDASATPPPLVMPPPATY